METLDNPGHPPMVLLVDDDAFIADLARAMMTGLGVELATVQSGDAALALLAQGQRVDLLLCDLNMPDMDGVELIRHLADRGFQGALALISGEDTGILDTARRLASAHQLRVIGALEKPLTREAMTRLLEQLEARPATRARPPAAGIGAEELRQAIASGQMIAHYQPKVSLARGEVIGVESLVRWQHPQRGLIYPNDFIPVAESAGLLPALTRCMLEVSLRQAARWAERGLSLSVSVNASMDDLADLSFPDALSMLARSLGMPVGNVLIEVTESQLLDRLSQTLDTLARLRLKGVGLAIDDFGTGFASFEQLRQIPFTQLKVDRQFVSGADADPKLRAILETSLLLADKLGMATVAEGVETVDDWSLLRELKCHEAQGYFIARPMPGDQLPDWIAQWQDNARRLCP